MFKDYYLIMGIGKDATPEEIEQAYKNADARLNVRGYISKEFRPKKQNSLPNVP